MGCEKSLKISGILKFSRHGSFDLRLKCCINSKTNTNQQNIIDDLIGYVLLPNALKVIFFICLRTLR